MPFHPGQIPRRFWKHKMSRETTMAAAAVPELNLGDVASTSLMTLACRAQETREPDPILEDWFAVEWLDRLRPALAASPSRLGQSVAAGEVNRDTQVYVALRARHFDRTAQQFAARHPGGLVVNLGCGLDSRSLRLRNSDLEWIDLDLPEAIAVRRGLLRDNNSARARAVAASVTDSTWLAQAGLSSRRPTLVLAEGLFMYLAGDEVRRLVADLRLACPGCELLAEVIHAYWLRDDARPAVDRRLRGVLHFTEGALFRSGLSDGRELESWGSGIRLLGEWSHFDEAEPRLGRLRKLRHFPLFRKRQWTIHYRLGDVGKSDS